MSAKHPFVTYIVTHHGKADTPVGDLARDLKSGYGVPSSGDLRTWLADVAGADQWALDAYDKAWDEYTTPTCSSPGCTATAAGGASHFCIQHGGRRHQAGSS